MNTRLLAASAATAALLSAAPALAATIIFDDFNINQSVIDEPFAGTTNTSTIPFNSGTRTLTAENIQNNGTPEGATTFQISGGNLSFSNNSGATGRGTVTYTNVGDISQGSRPFFFFEVAGGADSFDQIAKFTATAEDTSARVSTFSEIIGSGFDPFLFFSQFSGDADFNSIATLSFEIDSENVDGFGPQFRADGALASIQLNAVPVPAAGFMLFGALGGLVAMRRRKTRKPA